MIAPEPFSHLFFSVSGTPAKYCTLPQHGHHKKRVRTLTARTLHKTLSRQDSFSGLLAGYQ